jgi:D,D-heptose 1,7-bisphosphate phosphatase
MVFFSPHAAESPKVVRDMRRAVFLDRDGTLIEERDYLSDPEQVTVLPGAVTALRRLHNRGFLLVIVSNQSGVGRGYFTMREVEAVNRRVQQEFADVPFSGIYVAPEAPGDPSRGRKPSPQFLFDARDSLGIDLASSYMVGDKLIDLECGWNAGVKRSLLVRTGYGVDTERSYAGKLSRAVILGDLSAVADYILKDEGTPAAKSECSGSAGATQTAPGAG